MNAFIKIVTEPDEIAACMDIRWTVFVQEQGVSEQEERDGQDDKCSHVLARIDKVEVGAARFQQVNEYVKIQRVCVPKPYRGKSIGAELIQYIIKHARKMASIRAVKLGAQTHAVDFYRKLGFRELGDEYIDAGIPHIDMVLNFAD